MSENIPRRKLAAILAADVVGFSKMMGENEDQTLKNLKSCRTITDECITSHHGRVFGSAGDSIIAEFSSPVDAVLAATEFQRNLKLRNEKVSDEQKMMFRVGLNLGDVIVEGENLYGDGVNIAARLEALAEPGGITLSGKFHDEVFRNLQISFVSTGDQEMKNIQNPVSTYKIELSVIDKIEAKSYSESAFLNSKTNSSEKIVSDSKPPAIAVLPFSNMSGDPEQEFFVDGITEDIITNLSLWRTFPVISRNSSFTYKNNIQNLKRVSEELGAKYIVEGSVRKSGNRIRITAQLIDAEEDHHLWSEKCDRIIDDIFEVQDDVSQAIAQRVAPSVTGKEQNRILRKTTKDLTAWEEYLQGLRYFHGRQRTEFKDSSLKTAYEHFSNATKIDPTLSDAFAWLAFCGVFFIAQRIFENLESTINDTRINVQKALELKPDNPLAFCAMSGILFYSGDHKLSIDYASKAVNLNPSFVQSYGWLGLSQVHYGEYENAEKTFLKAIDISPLDPDINLIRTGLNFSCIGQKKFEEALEYIEKNLSLVPNRGNWIGFRASILGHLGKVDEAAKELNRYLEMRPNLKTTEDYRNIFVKNSKLTETIIDGFLKAGWEPEN